jgi:hypothetical protein
VPGLDQSLKRNVTADAFDAPFADSSNMRVVIATAASELTAQCETSSDRAPELLYRQVQKEIE